MVVLALTGCGASTTVSIQTEPAATSEAAAEPIASQPQTGVIAEQILTSHGQDIHYSYYLPDKYDETQSYPLIVVLPGYDMMWFGEDSSTRSYG